MCVTYLIFNSHVINAVSKDTQTHWIQLVGLKRFLETTRIFVFIFDCDCFFFKHTNKSRDIKF